MLLLSVTLRSVILLSVIRLSVSLSSVILLSVSMLSVILLSVIMLGVVAPSIYLLCWHKSKRLIVPLSLSGSLKRPSTEFILPISTIELDTLAPIVQLHLEQTMTYHFMLLQCINCVIM